MWLIIAAGGRHVAQAVIGCHTGNDRPEKNKHLANLMRLEVAFVLTTAWVVLCS